MAHGTLQKSSPWLVGSTAVRIDEHPAFATCHTRQGLEINIGDYVHIRPPDPHVDFYIARVERIYKDDSGKTLLYVHWYYRPADLQHHPPSYPKEHEVYHTMYFDSQLVESVVGHCQVLAKTDWLRLGTDERPNSRGKADTRYFYEFSYSAEKAVFKPVKDRLPGDDTLTCSIQLGGSSMRDTATLAKETADVLSNGERTVHGPKEILPTAWTDPRQVAKYVHVTYYKEDAFHTTAASVNNKTVRGSDHEQNLMKRKPVQSKLKKPRKQPRNGDMPTTSSQTIQTDFHSGTRQKEASSTTTSVFRNNQSEFPIVAGSMYKINREALPNKAPTNLKLIQTVLVAEKTAITVKVNFPSTASFKSYFGRAPNETQLDLTMDLRAGSGVPEQNIKKSMGTQPELDEEYCMPLRLAERVLVRVISCMEYMHQRHLWKFWILETPGTNMEGFDGPEKEFHQSNNTAKDYDRDDESKGELGAAEALTQLIPESSMIHETRGVNDDQDKSSPVPRNEGRSFRWGMRSLRRVSFGNRSTSGHSPNNCDAGTRDPPRHDREKSRKFLEYCDQQDQNSQSKPTHDFMQTERSSRMHPRREENLTVAGADKSKASSSRDKLSRSTTKGHILKLPKDMQGRWSSERYKTAQYKLIDIMHERGAVPGKPILRPALREEARRHIGDTGLLDHLLKHMTDTVVSNGERFRRRHNAEGAMEYWLEDGSLMEIRKEAGIEDPTWMPPPGWKPGDKLPGRGEFVYGSFNRGMSAAEVAEMKKLKEIVEELKCEIHSLSSRLERSKTEEITPEVQKEESDNDMPDQQSEESPQSNLQSDTGVGQQVDNRVADKEKASGDNMERLETMEVEIRKLTEERKAEKHELEVDLSELRKSVSAMQEDILCIKKALGFSQQVNIQDQDDGDAIANSSALLFSDSGPASTVAQHDRDAVMSDYNGTISHDVDPRNASAKTCSDNNIIAETFNVSNEGIMGVQRVGYGRDSDKDKGPEIVPVLKMSPIKWFISGTAHRMDSKSATLLEVLFGLTLQR